MRVGLIGLGAIGQSVLRMIGPDDEIDIVGALVANPSRPREMCDVKVCSDLAELLDARPHVVLEAAGHAALRCYGPPILEAGVDLLMVSVGALADSTTQQAIIAAARKGGSRASVVSGAIGGLDALAAAALGGLTRVTHTTRKPAKALLPTQEAAALTVAKELFRGCAREGVLLFPESVNVAAAVSLAGIGFDRTELRVIADPTLERNRHEVIAEGEFGALRFEISNIPSDANPRTGKLVAMSALHALRKRQARLVIG